MIRRATPADAEELSQLAAQTFLETFVDEFRIPYPPDDQRIYIETKLAPATFAERISDPAYGVWIGERDGRAIGFAVVGPCGLPHEAVSPGDVELKQLYVKREAQGTGVGRTLLGLSLDWMEARMPNALWIGVWSGNERAQRLYAAVGFEVVGGYQFTVGNWLDDEFIMRRVERPPVS
jgi:ribosomal protein S18 acetylase RimI-like enzyme